MQDVINPVNLPVFCRIHNASFPLDCMQYFYISHTIGPTDLLHPSPAPRYETLKVFLIYFPDHQNSSTMQSYVPRVAQLFTIFSLKFESSLLVDISYYRRKLLTYLLHGAESFLIS